MKHLIKLTILFSVFSAGVSFGQTQTTKKEGMNDPQNMTVNTDAEPFYPKGDQALYQYVYLNLKYSQEAKDKLVTGEVLMSFDVNPDSTVTNAIVISGPGFGVNEEVKALVEKLKFAPAVQNGVKVRMNVMMNFPVKAH
jgi:TonB family protein